MIAKEVALLLMKLHINERQWLCFFFVCWFQWIKGVEEVQQVPQ